MIRREEEFKALKAEHERIKAQRRAQRKVDRDLARRKEFLRICKQQVQTSSYLGWLDHRSETS
jgi:cell fate (sporulation/competence/biofilm development) regulator YlbF (YheA/YmcA/DUF963 family)